MVRTIWAGRSVAGANVVASFRQDVKMAAVGRIAAGKLNFAFGVLVNVHARSQALPMASALWMRVGVQMTTTRRTKSGPRRSATRRRAGRLDNDELATRLDLNNGRPIFVHCSTPGLVLL